MAEVLIFQCQGYYDWQFEPKDDESTGLNRAQILLGGYLIWQSDVGYWDEEEAQAQAVRRLQERIGELLK
jgi:hypothetical protein